MSTNTANTKVEPLDAWDPLDQPEEDDDREIALAAVKREVRNILKSYTGFYDLFSELIQNSLDAIEKRIKEGEKGYTPKLFILIDMNDPTVTVTDNGVGMKLSQFKKFVKPNMSFKSYGEARGSKGVGATYLAYGFNRLEVATKVDGKTYRSVLRDGRAWVDDNESVVARPRFESTEPFSDSFETLDRGTSVRIKLNGKNVRPKKLNWIGATSAEQWLQVLRATTPLGGVYLSNEAKPSVAIELRVLNSENKNAPDSTVSATAPEYLYPHLSINAVQDLRDFLKWQRERSAKGQDISKLPAKFQGLNGIWGEWTMEQILKGDETCPINVRLNEKETKLAIALDIKLYVFLAFSTELWDSFNDRKLGLRAGHRLLRGGLQIATRNMIQGPYITIPMTNNIGFQNLAHVIVHLKNTEPDLGRKGFQPEEVDLAEKLAVSAVTAFRKHTDKLRKPGAAKFFGDELEVETWKQAQVKHENDHPLVIRGKGLFMPTEELPIRSLPIVEQDVVALFNQMLSSGVVRGVQLLSSSSYKQYDGLYRIRMIPPTERFVIGDENPLGIPEDRFSDREKLETPVSVLEYKYNLDGLIEEIQSGDKEAENIELVVAWEMGKKWSSMFDVTTYLHPDHAHLRQIHGTTHSMMQAMSGEHAFEVVILKDLVNYLMDRSKEEQRQYELYIKKHEV